MLHHLRKKIGGIFMLRHLLKVIFGVYDNFNKLFKITSENCGYLINNAEFTEDQILLPYQILAKSIFN